jgi:tetratricopeptide (TPR) repeat protein
VVVRLFVVALTLVVSGGGSSWGEARVHAAHVASAASAALALIDRYDEDPARIDRAREGLESALRAGRSVEAMIALARVSLLYGDVRARTKDAKLAAYERGREIGERAIELAPRSEEAHLWYVANTGRWGQTKGVLRSLFLLPTVRRELDVIFELNPRSAPGHAIAGAVLFEVPALLGGDRDRAEEHLRKAIEIDAHYTLPRVDLAQLLIATGRHAEAAGELRRVLDERAPRSIADWTVKDVPRAREFLESITGRP